MKAKKPVNDTIGEVDCPFCSRPVPVRKNAGGKLYFLCDFRRTGGGGCGLISPNLNDGQAWISARMRAPTAAPAPMAKQEEPAPAPAVVTAPEQPAAPVNVNQASPGIFSSLMSARIL